MPERGPKLARATVQVAWRHGDLTKRRPTLGYETGVPGLVTVKRPTGWQLLHQSSGLLMERGLPTRKRAVELAEHLADVADWTKSVDELVADEGYLERARAARETWLDALEARRVGREAGGG